MPLVGEVRRDPVSEGPDEFSCAFAYQLGSLVDVARGCPR